MVSLMEKDANTKGMEWTVVEGEKGRGGQRQSGRVQKKRKGGKGKIQDSCSCICPGNLIVLGISKVGGSAACPASRCRE